MRGQEGSISDNVYTNWCVRKSNKLGKLLTKQNITSTHKKLQLSLLLFSLFTVTVLNILYAIQRGHPICKCNNHRMSLKEILG